MGRSEREHNGRRMAVIRRQGEGKPRQNQRQHNLILHKRQVPSNTHSSSKPKWQIAHLVAAAASNGVVLESLRVELVDLVAPKGLVVMHGHHVDPHVGAIGDCQSVYCNVSSCLSLYVWC